MSHAANFDGRAIERKLDRLTYALYHLLWKVNKMAHSVDETLAAAQAEGTQDDAIIALLVSVQKQLADVLAGALPPETQAKVDAVFDQLTANATKLATAIGTTPAGTPAPLT